MTLEETLRWYGQEHVLKRCDDLTAAEREELFARLSAIDCDGGVDAGVVLLPRCRAGFGRQ